MLRENRHLGLASGAASVHYVGPVVRGRLVGEVCLQRARDRVVRGLFSTIAESITGFTRARSWHARKHTELLRRSSNEPREEVRGGKQDIHTRQEGEREERGGGRERWGGGEREGARESKARQKHRRGEPLVWTRMAAEWRA